MEYGSTPYIGIWHGATALNVNVQKFAVDVIISIYKQVRPSAALASWRALRPAINGRLSAVYRQLFQYTLISLHKCAYRTTSRLSVVLRITFKFNPVF